MTGNETAEKIIAFPDLDSLRHPEKIALVLHAMADEASHSKHRQVLMQAAELVIQKDQLQSALEASRKHFTETQFQQDLKLTLLEDQLIWLAEKLSGMQARSVDPKDFSSYKRALDNIESLLRYQQKTISDTQRVLEPYGAKNESDLADAVRKFVIEVRARNYQIDELRKDGETGQQEVRRLLHKLSTTQAETEQSREEITLLKAETQNLQTQTMNIERQNQELMLQLKQSKETLLNSRILRSDLEQKAVEQQLLIEALEARLKDSSQQQTHLNDQIELLQLEISKSEAKLAIKNEYAQTLNTEKTSLAESLAPLKKQLHTRNQWLGVSVVLALVSLGALIWQNQFLFM